MSQRLREAERVFLKRYKEWLHTVEEGLSSVAYFYREGHVENGDRLLVQMMEGFAPFSSDNMTMRYLFAEKVEIAEEMQHFHEKVENAKSISSYDTSNARLRFVASDLMPAFQRWKLLVQSVGDEPKRQDRQ
ncbi:hypothetical protein [Alteribacillus sp. YIM 98480]|uniref:hypothetical protein n=1 Tax=Alteribacillus sp. YIM 98480 TaxID=2606599 RepID=UPI00131C932F|nr:hypothetical protein [Alteribacillus sp. YIM 98480]